MKPQSILSPRCPKCKTSNVGYYVNGDPTDEAERDVQKGLARYGGCLVGGDEPDFFCLQCGFEWRDDGVPGDQPQVSDQLRM